MPLILYKNIQSSRKGMFIFPCSYSSVYSADVINQDFRGVIHEDFRMSVMFSTLTQTSLQFLSAAGAMRILSPLGGEYGNCEVFKWQ